MNRENEQDYDEVLEKISNALSIENWHEGKTLTVMFKENGEPFFAKLRLVGIKDKPSAADLRGTPE